MYGHKPKALFSHTHTETDRKKQSRCKKNKYCMEFSIQEIRKKTVLKKQKLEKRRVKKKQQEDLIGFSFFFFTLFKILTADDIKFPPLPPSKKKHHNY